MMAKISQKEIFNKVRQHKQTQVLRFWDELNDGSRQRLLEQLLEIDFDLIDKLSARYVVNPPQTCARGELETIEVIKAPQSYGEKQERENARIMGEKALANGQVAAMLVSGGQGTRLGFDGPKGLFPVGTFSHKTLFELHAEKILALNRKYQVSIPWYIMTSEINDEAIREYFAENNYFGLGEKNVIFMCQRIMPALDQNGKLILDAQDHIFASPNGHGGVLLALKDSGAIIDMKNRKIQWIFYFQVDNVLVKMCDPVFIGYHLQKRVEMSAKVVAKRDAYEKVGVIGKLNGKIQVIEYSDLSCDEMEACNPDGSLKYNGGSIAIHCFNRDFLEREIVKNSYLPFHVAFKKVPFLDEGGHQLIYPQAPNAYKFEMFIFDALGDAASTMILEVEREVEFSPIKNQMGNDSPLTAIRDLNRFYGRWLERAGVIVPKDENDNPRFKIEISPLVAMDAEDLKGISLPARLETDLYLGEETVHGGNASRLAANVQD
jgi:UDP-N-acetylglucosamine/UDP-N-acetylgalactosamine diphosphorylase